jgi:hypothetical protein
MIRRGLWRRRSRSEKSRVGRAKRNPPIVKAMGFAANPSPRYALCADKRLQVCYIEIEGDACQTFWRELR